MRVTTYEEFDAAMTKLIRLARASIVRGPEPDALWAAVDAYYYATAGHRAPFTPPGEELRGLRVAGRRPSLRLVRGGLA